MSVNSIYLSVNILFVINLDVMCNAYIPPVTTFVLGKKGNKQHEIDMPNANPARMIPYASIYHVVPSNTDFGTQVGFTRLLRKQQVGIGQAKCPHWESNTKPNAHQRKAQLT